jgi:hypothetical protein
LSVNMSAARASPHTGRLMSRTLSIGTDISGQTGHIQKHHRLKETIVSHVFGRDVTFEDQVLTS